MQRVLRDLTAEGLVDVRPGSGSFVAAAPSPRAPADTSWQESVLGARITPELSRTLDLWRLPGSEVIRLKDPNGHVVHVRSLSKPVGPRSR